MQAFYQPSNVWQQHGMPYSGGFAANRMHFVSTEATKVVLPLVACSSNNYGQLGIGGAIDAASKLLIPSKVAGDLQFKFIAAAFLHTCKLYGLGLMR